MIQTEFAKWFAENRTRLGLTQEEVARRLFQSQQSIYKYEQGLCLPRLTTLYDMVQLFGVPFIFQPELKECQGKTPTPSPCEEIEELFNTIQTLFPDIFNLSSLDSMLKETSDMTDVILKDLTFHLGRESFNLQAFQALGLSSSALSDFGKQLEEEAINYINQFKSLEPCDPHELWSLPSGGINFSLRSEGVEASVSISLFESGRIDETKTPQWEWYIFSELDGEVDDFVISLDMNEFSGEDAARSLTELTLKFVNSFEFQSLVKERYLV